MVNTGCAEKAGPAADPNAQQGAETKAEPKAGRKARRKARKASRKKGRGARHAVFSPGEALRPTCTYDFPSAEESASHYKKSYVFRRDWFTPHVPVWNRVLSDFKGKPDVHYLEVGLFEGRSAIWMLENILTHPGARLTGIDIFPDDLKVRYLANLNKSGHRDKATTLVGFSRDVLRKLPTNSFDIVYIDGSHTADDVLTDIVLSWDLLRVGGVLILDDYLLRIGANYPDELRPRVAIDAFITVYRNYLTVMHRCYQAILRKVDSPCDADKWDCSPIGGYRFRWAGGKLVDRQTRKQIPLTKGERTLLQRIIKSRRFGEKKYHLDRSITRDPGYADLKKKLDLEI
jgi:predicted O-methyltransferase YrrM